MSFYLGFLILLLSIQVAFITFVVFLLRANQKFLIESQRQTSEIMKSTIQQAITLLGTKDPLSYQAVMSMEKTFLTSEPVGMSDEEEAQRWTAAHPNGVRDYDSVNGDVADFS